jgi:hypothetical protein
MVDLSWLTEWILQDNAEADASPQAMESSVVTRLWYVVAAYMSVANVIQYVHKQLHYESAQCVWREVVLYLLREHFIWLGINLSENLWLTKACSFADIGFKDLCLAACGLSSLLIVVHRAVHIYTTRCWLRLLLCMNTSCLLYALFMEATWQQLLQVYVVDLTVRLVLQTIGDPRGRTKVGIRRDGNKDMRFKANRKANRP